MKIRTKIRKGFTLIELLVVIAIMASLGAVGYVAILAFSNAGDKQAAKSNIGQVGTVLNQFRQSRGNYPCDATATQKAVVKAESYGSLTGDTANDYFRQLFCKSGAIEESNFFAKIPNMREGDNKIANGACLEAGENAFAYVMRPAAAEETTAKGGKKNKKAAEAAVPQKMAISSRGSSPLLFCCVKNNAPVAANELTFDMEAFSDYAIMYTTDNKTVDLDDEKLTADDADPSTGRFVDYDPFPENRATGESSSTGLIVLPPAGN